MGDFCLLLFVSKILKGLKEHENIAGSRSSSYGTLNPFVSTFCRRCNILIVFNVYRHLIFGQLFSLSPDLGRGNGPLALPFAIEAADRGR